jgi:hypothetical protein
MLRDVFVTWGLPLFFRVDNGHPWGSAHDLPPALALWLIGLGVQVHWNPAGRPQHNGTVERTNGVSQDWAEPRAQACRSDLEAALAYAAEVQRERYESIQGRTRLESFPGLLANPRRYSRESEDMLWDLSRVDEFFDGRLYKRKADRIGQIWIDNRGKLLGKAYRGQGVLCRLDPASRDWVVEACNSEEIKRFPAEELSRASILSLQVGYRRESRQGPARRG